MNTVTARDLQEAKGIYSKVMDATDILSHVQHQLNFVSCNTEDPSLGFIIIGIAEYLKKAQDALNEAIGGTDGDDK